MYGLKMGLNYSIFVGLENERPKSVDNIKEFAI